MWTLLQTETERQPSTLRVHCSTNVLPIAAAMAVPLSKFFSVYVCVGGLTVGVLANTAHGRGDGVHAHTRESHILSTVN